MTKSKISDGAFALITGASSGIGEATAMKLAERGYNLILTARRVDRLEVLSKKCRELGSPNVIVQHMDVRQLPSVEAAFNEPKVMAALESLLILVNNAGLAKGFDKLDEGKISDWQTMMDTNVMGLLYVTRLAIPYIKKTMGHIVNVGSVSGVWTYPGGGVYCASKAAVRAISEGLRMDLIGSHVRVTNIEPGAAHTEFALTRLGGNVELSKNFYKDYLPLKAEDIADCIDWSISRPSHVNIQEMIIFPTDQASIYQFNRDNPRPANP